MTALLPAQSYARFLERQAAALRARLRLDDRARLEPSALVATYDAIVLADLLSLAGDCASELALLRRERAAWSAVAFRMDGGPWLITWNPWHAPTRVRVSLLEEICHIVLGHEPTALVPDPATGLPRRTYSRAKEREAYGVAAAAVVPYAGLRLCLEEGATVAEIAEAFGVSRALVEMRITTTRARLAGAGGQASRSTRPA